MVASPYRLLDCATTSEGGSAIVLTGMERARDLPAVPIRLLGGGRREWGPTYVNPPRVPPYRPGRPPRRRARPSRRPASPATTSTSSRSTTTSPTRSPATSRPTDTARQGKAHSSCRPRTSALDGRYPICDRRGRHGALHTGYSQLTQKVVRAVQQLRGTANVNQVPGAKIALANWPKGLLLMTSGDL
ncbi:hypothetical protein ACU686_42635 [Yinghuangia aomiensis]